jgi:hypothetical protein
MTRRGRDRGRVVRALADVAATLTEREETARASLLDETMASGLTAQEELAAIRAARKAHGVCVRCGEVAPCECIDKHPCAECNGDGTGPAIGAGEEQQLCPACRFCFLCVGVAHIPGGPGEVLKPCPSCNKQQQPSDITEHTVYYLTDWARREIRSLMRRKGRGYSYKRWSLVLAKRGNNVEPIMRVYYLHPDGGEEFINVGL